MSDEYEESTSIESIVQPFTEISLTPETTEQRIRIQIFQLMHNKTKIEDVMPLLDQSKPYISREARSCMTTGLNGLLLWNNFPEESRNKLNTCLNLLAESTTNRIDIDNRHKIRKLLRMLLNQWDNIRIPPETPEELFFLMVDGHQVAEPFEECMYSSGAYEVTVHLRTREIRVYGTADQDTFKEKFLAALNRHDINFNQLDQVLIYNGVRSAISHMNDSFYNQARTS